MQVDSTGSTSQSLSFYRQTKEANRNTSRLILRGDSLNLSQAGMMMNCGKLNVTGGTAAAATVKTNAAQNDPTVKTIQKSFEEITQTLDKLKTLSETALNPELTDLERLDLQVEATKLQTKLFKAAHRLGLELYPGTGGHVSIERALSRIGWEEDKMMEFLTQAGEKIASGDYTRAGGGADISSLSVYEEPPLPRADLVLDPEHEDTLWMDGVDIFQTPQTTQPDEDDLLLQEPVITDVALGGTTLAGIAAAPKPAGQAAKTVAEGGSLTKLLFNDYRVSAAARLDQAETEAADPSTSWIMQTGILLTDLKSTTLSVKRIEKQIERLEELKANFDKLVKNMPPEGYGTANVEDQPEWYVHETSLTRSSYLLADDAPPHQRGGIAPPLRIRREPPRHPYAAPRQSTGGFRPEARRSLQGRDIQRLGLLDEANGLAGFPDQPPDRGQGIDVPTQRMASRLCD